MKRRANHPISLGSVLILFIASLFASTPLYSQATNESRAANTADSPALPGSRPHDNTFVIGNDDVLTINVWKEPDLSRESHVRSDGKITLPLIGEVQAAGLTPLQLEQELTTKLRDYITKPEVAVMVEQINSEKFNILGQVMKPGSYSLTLAPTIVDAIAIADGFRDFAKQKSIYILRHTAGGGETRIAFNYKKFIKGKNQQPNVKLEPHDTIIVP